MVSRRKVSVIHNGIDMAPFEAGAERQSIRAALGIPEDAVVVGTVGRLSEVKRVDLLIAAFAQIRDQCPQARLLIVGHGPERATLQKLQTALRLDHEVCFAGYQSKPAPYLQAMDLFALTSRSEGLPLSVLEAWATGLPVVASYVGGLPEIVEQGQNGLLFPAGDQTALAAAISRLLENPQMRTALGQAGRDRVRRSFSGTAMWEKYSRHYSEMLAGRSKVAGDVLPWEEEGRYRYPAQASGTFRKQHPCAF
jgi:glycosyltransferase involved in cell wall biosynthesis